MFVPQLLKFTWPSVFSSCHICADSILTTPVEMLFPYLSAIIFFNSVSLFSTALVSLLNLFFDSAIVIRRLISDYVKIVSRTNLRLPRRN